jgi:hypothetical protein
VTQVIVCSVCSEPGDEKTISICNTCGEPFHLNQRNDVTGKDCGVVWINEQFLSLEFACQRCLDGETPAPARAKPTVLRPRTGKRRYRRRE